MPRPHGRPIATGSTGQSNNGPGITLTVTGVKELDHRLSTIPKKEARRIVRRAVTIGLRIIQRGIQSEIRPKAVSRTVGKRKPRKKTTHRQRTKFKRAIGIRFVRATEVGKTEGKVGVGVGKRRGSYPPHAIFHATGTVERVRKKLGGFFVTAAPAAGTRTRTRTVKSLTDRSKLRTGRHDGDDFVGRGFRKSAPSAQRAMKGIIEHELTQLMNRATID